MFDNSCSYQASELFKRQVMNELKANRAEREAAGITLRQQREQERRLALEQAAEAQTNAQTGTLAVETAEVQPVPAPEDGAATGRHVRIGILAVLVVVLIVLWIKQRKPA